MESVLHRLISEYLWFWKGLERSPEEAVLAGKVAITSPIEVVTGQRGLCLLGLDGVSRSQPGIRQRGQVCSQGLRPAGSPLLGISKSMTQVNLSPKDELFLQTCLAFCFLGRLPSFAFLSFLVTP